MKPRHLVPLDAEPVCRVCDDIAIELRNMHSVTWLELVTFRDTRTPHDAHRLINALRHIAKRDDLASKVEALIEPKAGVLVDLKGGGSHDNGS